MVNTTTSDGNSSDATNQGGKMERNYKDDGSTTRMNRLEISVTGPYEIQETHRKDRSTATMNISTHKSERQVLEQYMKAAHRWSIS
jgi:hypothetical protein